MAQAKSAMVFLVDGFEEMEAIAPIDLMRRAGIEVTVAALGANREVTGRSGISMNADRSLASVTKRDFDCLVLPGGRLAEDERVLARVREQVASGRLVGAICAAPTVLARAGVLNGRSYTAHFSVAEMRPDLIADRAVVADDGIVTSRGAGTATEFALALITRLTGETRAREVAESICYRPGEEPAFRDRW